MKKLTLPNLLRWTAILIFIIGAGLGWDAGSRQLIADGRILETFDLWRALLCWFAAFALGLLFLAVARLLERLDQ